MDARDLNLYGIIGLIGGALLLAGTFFDAHIPMAHPISAMPWVYIYLEIWCFRIAAVLTLIFCAIRLVRRLYGLKMKRLVPVLIFYILGIILMYMSLVDVELLDHSYLIFAGIPVGMIGCIVCALKVSGTGGR